RIISYLMNCNYLNLVIIPSRFISFFFFTDPATTEIYTLSLHDALPIWQGRTFDRVDHCLASTYSRESDSRWQEGPLRHRLSLSRDRKSTRLNSSHSQISYAVFCLKKKKKKKKTKNHENYKNRHT